MITPHDGYSGSQAVEIEEATQSVIIETQKMMLDRLHPLMIMVENLRSAVFGYPNRTAALAVDMPPELRAELVSSVKDGDEWTNEQADAEGWGIYNDNEIQRDDEANWFTSDEAAVAFVRVRAQQGSLYHQRAIRIHDSCAEQLAADRAEEDRGS